MLHLLASTVQFTNRNPSNRTADKFRFVAIIMLEVVHLTGVSHLRENISTQFLFHILYLVLVCFFTHHTL